MVTEISGVSVDPSTDGRALSLSHALPIPVSGWSLRPFQIVSLFQVIKFKARDFYKLANSLKGLQAAIDSIKFRHLH